MCGVQVRDPDAFDDITGELPAAGHRLLSMKSYPVMQWFMGVFVLGAATWFLVHVIEGTLGELFHGRKEGFWWQYLVAAVLYILGLFVFGTGKVETVVFDKASSRLVVSKRGPFHCAPEVRVDRPLHDLTHLTLEALGREHRDTDNRHFKVGLHFIDGTRIKVLESRTKITALERLKRIREFVFGNADIGAGALTREGAAQAAAARVTAMQAMRATAAAASGAGAPA